MVKAFFSRLNKIKLPGKIYALAGSFIIASGWSWYHFYRRLIWVYAGKTLLVWLSVFLSYLIIKKIYRYIVHRTQRHVFWRDKFYVKLDELYFFCSLIFIIFFIEVELLSVTFCLILLPFIFWRLQEAIAFHPGGSPWLKLNKYVFYLAYFIFCLEAFLQFAAYHFYILDNNIKFFNIVLFRSFAMTLFWLFGFAVANEWYQWFKGVVRYFFVTVWVIIFTAALVLWTVNLGILYYSGLYFSPIALEHFEGSGNVVFNWNTLYLTLGAAAVFTGFIVLVRKNLKIHREIGRRHSSFYNYSIGFVAIVIIFVLSSFRNTPERSVLQSFYRYYFGKSVVKELSLPLQKKLAKFGLIYETNQFYVTSRREVYAPTSTKFLPIKFDNVKPNILIIELESFSSRLTGAYGSKFKNITPGLDDFSNDKNTTLFYNYYNASTPTITGILSQLCSFLPPTGHNEIQNDRKLQSHRLLCLPEVLRTKAGYKYSAYITAVDKKFANKEGIFTSAGVDKVFGTSELKEYIKAEPLSWGYSDHQLFPVVFDFMKKSPQPFVMIYSTVDTHPPFNLAKDAIDYEDGELPVLNMFHTTDDAFKLFWQEFKKSDLYNNTIVIAVADHAIFPGALTTDLFPAEEKTLTYYDKNFFGMYIPESVLPKKVDVYSSGIDFTPTLLQVLNINIPNSFEGHSIFDDRKDFPNLLGMHELGLYINQVSGSGQRVVSYNIPSEINCEGNNKSQDGSEPLTLCEYLDFYEWKRQMFEEGRFWKH